MTKSHSPMRLLFLLLLFCGTLCNSMIISFMSFFLVDGLGSAPWVISVYSVLAISLTLTANKLFASRIDAGARVFPLIGFAVVGYLTATLALSLSPAFWTVMTVGVIGFGMSSSAVSTMFSLGGSIAERQKVERSRFNAYMRATTSTAWMIGPAVTFLIAERIGLQTVFISAFCVALVWLLLWWTTLPRDIAAKAKEVLQEDAA